jgi:cell division protease FtsH
MSSRIGPMAWGSQGQVFLGEDLVHTRDYSDETARVIDEEVARILREQEDRCREALRTHRKALDLVARALLEYETIDGAEVNRLIDVAGNGSAPAEGDGDGDGAEKKDSGALSPHAHLAPPAPPT